MSESNERFLRLFEPVRERLWRFIRAMVFKWDNSNADLAQDIMSETVLQVLERFESLRDEQAFLSYCFSIAHRIHKSGHRRKKFWVDSAQSADESMSSTEISPELATDIRALYEALDRLPARIQEAVVLFELSDLSLEEIRSIQGGSLSGVKSRVSRGRAELKRLLCEQPHPQTSASGPQVIPSLL